VPEAWLLIVECGLIGLAAGLLGGLAGVGGSMIMLPALHFFLKEQTPNTHHVYMAAAMTVNIAVALPAALRHHRLGSVRTDLIPTLLSTTLVAMVAGVLVSNVVVGDRLRVYLAGFLACYCAFNLWRLAQGGHDPDPAGERTGRARLAVSGAGTGFVGGLLGLGGGVMLVPMLQMLCKMPLRQSIATSSAVIAVTAVIGAGLKLATLHTLGESARDALTLALIMAPTAVLGGYLGASLTHKLPIQTVRIVVTLLLAIASARLAGVF
jgi:uncharacterized protein